MKHIIIGGVAGGATAAARIRRLTEKDEIILLEKGEYISYANCGLPYYIGGAISEREKLFVQSPEVFSTRFNIDIRTKSEVIAIHPDKMTVEVKSPDGSIYTESYDRLLLSPGATPVRPPLPGIDSDGIFTLRNVADTDAVKSYITNNSIKRAAIIGAGFIGLEMAENLKEAGIDVSVIEMANQVMAPIDYSMAAIVHQHLLSNGVKLYLETAVSSFSRGSNGINVQFKSGDNIDVDIVILSIGVRPLTSLALDAGLKIGKRGGISVNPYLQTSDENIYAVGDAIEFPHPLTEEPWLNYLAGPANRQARIVADNMVFGNKKEYEGAIGTSIAKVFDLTVASTGLPAKRLAQDNVAYKTATIHPFSHAGYYPGATPISIKVVFSPDNGKLFGAQIVGYDGVDKRIDMFAQVIKRNGSVTELINTEHAYAPPYSSAKDPVAMAGYVAENILTGRMSPIYWRELKDLDKRTITLIDVRTPDEFATGAIEGATNIPLDSLRSHLAKIPSDKPIVLYCGVGLRGYLASNILKLNGYKDVRNLIGGLKTYKQSTAEISTPPKCSMNSKDKTMSGHNNNIISVDACGLLCPGPILKLKQAMESASKGETLQIYATDPGFVADAKAWCESTGNNFVSHHSEKGIHVIQIKKGEKTENQGYTNSSGKGKSFILFSDDLDKALATFVLANGAAATGKKVSIFFTFWGFSR